MSRRHTSWCVADYRCGLGEHRSEPLVVDLGQAGRIIATRVLSDRTDREQLEVRHALWLPRGSEPLYAARLLKRLTVLVETTAHLTARRAA